MNNAPRSLLKWSFLFFGFISPLQSEESPSLPTPEAPKKSTLIAAKHFEPFTGKVLKNKVRVRLQPSYEGSVLRELNRNDLIIIKGETDDFYAVEPPSDMKAYVFRTFVLDQTIEGTRVNVRLKPDLDAPVIAQLNSGDHIEGGTILPSHNKWLEIKVPESVRFYIAKEYIEKAGDVGFLTRLKRKGEQKDTLLKATQEFARMEMEKTFNQIDLKSIQAGYQQIIADYPEFPDAIKQAKEALVALQTDYTTKKIAYLETLSHASSSTEEANKKLSAELEAHKSKIARLEDQIKKNKKEEQTTSLSSAPSASQSQQTSFPVTMAAWIPVEERLLENWSRQHPSSSTSQDFYEEQKKEAFIIQGVIDPYQRVVKNKPGDFMLLNTTSKLPICFLYSTSVNLQEYVGREVSILVSPRPNHHFAFPAYFVLSVE